MNDDIKDAIKSYINGHTTTPHTTRVNGESGSYYRATITFPEDYYSTSTQLAAHIERTGTDTDDNLYIKINIPKDDLINYLL